MTRTLLTLAALALLAGCGAKVVVLSQGQPVAASEDFTLHRPFVYDETGQWVRMDGDAKMPSGSVWRPHATTKPATRPTK